MPVQHFRFTQYDLILIENFGGNIKDIKENISKDLNYIEETKEKLPSAIYIEDLSIRLNMIENALNTLDSDKKSSKHNANKAFETCVSSIRQMKSRINEQIDEANKAIHMLDECLDICNKYRK